MISNPLTKTDSRVQCLCINSHVNVRTKTCLFQKETYCKKVTQNIVICIWTSNTLAADRTVSWKDCPWRMRDVFRRRSRAIATAYTDWWVVHWYTWSRSEWWGPWDQRRSCWATRLIWQRCKCVSVLRISRYPTGCCGSDRIHRFAYMMLFISYKIWNLNLSTFWIIQFNLWVVYFERFLIFHFE